MPHSYIQKFNSKENKVLAVNVPAKYTAENISNRVHSDRVYKARDDMSLKYAVIDSATGSQVVLYCETWSKGGTWQVNGFLWTPLHHGFSHYKTNGGGYDKSSAAVAGCIRDAGIKLAHSCSGVGDSAAVAALMAIAAKATGKRKFIVVEG